MTTPTVGRKVWFRPGAIDLEGQGEHIEPMEVIGDQPLDATVVAVHPDDCVNLVVFDAFGTVHIRHMVKLVQDGQLPPDGGQRFATWMPYQVSQAKKNETGGVVELQVLQTRAAAMQSAIGLHKGTGDAELIVKEARKIEGYLKGAGDLPLQALDDVELRIEFERRADAHTAAGEEINRRASAVAAKHEAKSQPDPA